MVIGLSSGQTESLQDIKIFLLDVSMSADFLISLVFICTKQ